MRNLFSGKQMIFFDLALHMAMIAALAIAVARGGVLLDHPLFITGCAALAVAITVYTAKRVARGIEVGHARREKELILCMAKLHTLSSSLDAYAQELERRADALQENQVKISDNMSRIKQYESKMSELAAVLESGGAAVEGFADGDR